MKSCALPTVLAILLLLSCSATPGLASVRRDQTTTRLTALAAEPGSSQITAGGLSSDAGSARSPTTAPRRLRPTVAIRVDALAAGAAPISPTTAPGAEPRPRARYRPPLDGPLAVLHRFEHPASPYAAGHRGVDLAATSGQLVLAARGGRVQFAGPVAGRGVVVIAHSDGIRTEYEPVAPAVHAGSKVQTGQVIGRILGTHDMCRPSSCLHWGARRGDTYIDPMLLLNPLGPVRLLPWTA